jgi:hypothetical protein
MKNIFKRKTKNGINEEFEKNIQEVLIKLYLKQLSEITTRNIKSIKKNKNGFDM